LCFIDFCDVPFELNLDTHTAAVILFQGDASDIQESIEHQGETFVVMPRISQVCFSAPGLPCELFADSNVQV
jgi:hypothetical protein